MNDPTALTSNSEAAKPQQHLAAAALLVRDYDEAIIFFANDLDFEVVQDVDLGSGKRWVLLRPPGAVGSGQAGLLLAKASTPQQVAQIGKHCGGRVGLFLHTDDFGRDYERMKSRGVVFVEEPRDEIYGMVVVFKDLYGNKWDLIQPKS